MNKVSWNGLPLDASTRSLPTDLRDTIFNYLPPAINFTPQMDSLAQKYLNNQINGRDYAAMQAAAFLRPNTKVMHNSRRGRFEELCKSAAGLGFSIPPTFSELIASDEYVDRIHHNTIWIQLPEELWRLPSDKTKLMFLAFIEGQGCCAWHLLLSNDGSHEMVCCKHPFGMVSFWPGGVPDYANWTVENCGDSIEEWLYHFFAESREHDESYIEKLRLYHQENGG